MFHCPHSFVKTVMYSTCTLVVGDEGRRAVAIFEDSDGETAEASGDKVELGNRNSS